MIERLKQELDNFRGMKRDLEILQNFFKTGPGQYGEGDVFIGISMPNQRKVAKMFHKEFELEKIEELLQEEIHEYRSVALIMLVEKYSRSKSKKEQQEIAELYLKNKDRINNWDLVDISAHKILGPYLWDKDRSVLKNLANEDHLWSQRIAMISTFYFIRNKEFTDTLEIAKILLDHKHDLIHKAVGWMLREIGNRNREVEEKFLRKNYKKMPRTMLRYAIEKFPEELRQRYLKGTI